MARYGLKATAFSSYMDSFHGKAVMRFGKADAADCADCHGMHAVRSPAHPDAPTHPHQIAQTCGQCHPGSHMNFALSGANHLRLKIEQSKLLTLQELFFKLLTLGTTLGLLGLIALDLRRKIWCKRCVPSAGRGVAMLVALSYLALVCALGMALFGIHGARYFGLIALVFIILALVINWVRRRGSPHAEVSEPRYVRFTLSQRLQHICLIVSFSLLVLTGMPLRFARVDWIRQIIDLFGGLDSARLIHRGAALLLIVTWIWHTVFLLYRWKKAKFSLASWTMFPRWKDFTDFYDTVRYGIGLRQTPPAYERFHFKEKFEYFAVFWGNINMVLSGLILWFPVLAGRGLPDVLFGVAYIAHSYEAILAMLAIVIWHFYNTHFDPEHFPMNRVWLTGTMTASEMAREHPLEKQRLDQAHSATE
jgi:formate dehydrogenase subunit gamma